MLPVEVVVKSAGSELNRLSWYIDAGRRPEAGRLGKEMSMAMSAKASGASASETTHSSASVPRSPVRRF